MDLVFEKKEELDVKVYGTAHKVRKPSISEVEDYHAKTVEAGDSGALGVTKDFLKILGLPVKVTKDLQIDHFLLLVETLVAPKKKE